MERSILNLQLKDEVPTKKVKQKLKSNIDAVHSYRRTKWDWAGHIARITDNRWAHKITFWRPNKERKTGGQKKTGATT